MDKVREYINFTFKNPIDREIIYYLHQNYWNLSRRARTASVIFSQIPKCNRPTFNKRLEVLRSPRMNAIVRRPADPAEIDPSIWEKRQRGEPVPPAPRHRLPFLYFLHPDMTVRLRDVEGFASVVDSIRTHRKWGGKWADDPESSDAAIIQMFLDREERGIFIPYPLIPPEE